jgi:hypothetical protein
MGFYLNVPGEMTTDNAKKIILKYLFLSVDHKITKNEMEWLSINSNHHKGWDVAKDSIIKKAEDILESKDNTDRYEKIIKTFDEIADGYSEYYHRLTLYEFLSILHWEGIFSENRLRLARYWVQCCKIDQSIFDEMEDTMNTSVVLRKQKKWIESNPMYSLIYDAILSEIDKNQKEVHESLSNLVVLG